MRFVGRDDELTRAHNALLASRRTGQGAILLVTGDPGVGKSTIMTAIAERAALLGFSVGVSKAEEADQIAPGAPLLIALRSGSSPLLDAESFTSLSTLYGQQLWLVDRVASLLEELSSRQPVLVAIDDVQWADRLTRFALRILPSRLSGSPVVWVLASRDPHGSATADALSAARDGVPVHQLELDPLSEDDVASLALEQLGEVPTGRAADLLRGAGGNPFLVTELISGIAAARARGDFDDAIPETLRQMVSDRCRAMPEASQRLVKMCAVLGRPVHADDLMDLLGDDADDLDPDWLPPLVQFGVLVGHAQVVQFRHDLIRQAVYDTLSPTARRALHRRCAVWLLGSDGGALAAAPHALAFAIKGDTEAVHILSAAASDAAAVDPVSAADLARHAYQLSNPTGPDHAELGRRAVELLTAAHRDAEAADLADIVLAAAPDNETAAHLQFFASRSLWRMGRIATIASRIEILAAFDVSDVARVRMRAIQALTMSRTETGDVARSAAEDALVASRGIRDRPSEQLALEALGEVARNEGRHADAYRHFHELRSIVGDEFLASEIGALQLLDRYDEAARLLEGARRVADEMGVAETPDLIDAQMWQDFNLGRFDEAEVSARSLIQLAGELGNRVSAHEARLILASISLMRGDLPEARTQLTIANAEPIADWEVRSPGSTLMSGWITAAEGDLTGALTILRPLLEGAEASRSFWPWWPGWMRVFTELGVAAGDADFAQRAVQIAQIGADRNPGIASFEGQALHLRGILDRDLETLAEAVRVLEGAPRQVMLAGALMDYGSALLTDGQRKPGIRALDEAWPILERSGLINSMVMVQRAMQRAGVRRKHWPTPDRRGATGWESLTTGERRVAELVGSGRSNRAAAQELRVSPNTVATHLRSIFAKLDISSRVQLANVLHEVEPAQRRPDTPLDSLMDVSRIQSPDS
ncbi:helix-turn-helix transcriptional regulator [Nocardioides conyzicola]|uniref:LuxR family transcriptional regulator n=1 Tax=Nocardioides conyzicola TaxID=1651781 RepID=A0ABP8WMV8_9ACTN